MAKILIVEDERLIRLNLRELLENEKYEVIEAGTVIEAMTVLASSSLPDLIFLDVKLYQGEEGFEILEAVRKNERTCDIPVIMLTARSTREDYRRGMELEADDYISKPFTRAEILGAVIARLKRQKRRVTITPTPLAQEKKRKPKKNYNFTLRVYSPSRPKEGELIILTEPFYLIGRGSHCSIKIEEDRIVSSEHASLQLFGKEIPPYYRFIDGGIGKEPKPSRNGNYVNGQKVDVGVNLKDDDTIVFSYIFKDEQKQPQSWAIYNTDAVVYREPNSDSGPPTIF
jgi:CheY-like chemotaxis protein